MLGIVCYFVNYTFRACTVILGLKRLFGEHTGYNMSLLIIQVIKAHNLSGRLGFCVLNNAGDNGICLRAVENIWLLLALDRKGIITTSGLGSSRNTLQYREACGRRIYLRVYDHGCYALCPESSKPRTRPDNRDGFDHSLEHL